MAYVVERKKDDGTPRYLAQYRDPEGRIRSAGTHSSRRAAERAANREEQRVLAGNWHDHTLGAVPFQAYVEDDWLPSKHIEATTRAAYVSNLNKHFFPFFGKKLMHQITPSLVQDWVTKAAGDGLSARSIRKYHTMLHSIFKRAVRDQLIVTNPCEHTELPKVITKKSRTLTPAEYKTLITAIPDRYRLLVETAIETGMRWGELIALRPRHIDFLTKTVTVEETIVEVSRRHSPTGERFVSKAYPKDTTSPEPSASTTTGSRRSRCTSRLTVSDATSRCSPPPQAPPSPATRSAPAPGSPPSKPVDSTSPFACTTCGMPTRPGCSPKAPTSEA